MNVLDRIAEKLEGLRWRYEDDDEDENSLHNGHGFVTGRALAESEIRRIEQEYGVSLPSEYRAFLKRFGDGKVGPCTFHPLREALTEESRLPFPLARPFMGMEAPAAQALPEPERSQEFLRLSEAWEAIPHDHGVAMICDYGCSIYGVLILNGPYRGKIWTLGGNAAYYGPFDGSEWLVNGYWMEEHEWERGDPPRDYSFFEWYELWLDGKLRSAGLAGD